MILWKSQRLRDLPTMSLGEAATMTLSLVLGASVEWFWCNSVSEIVNFVCATWHGLSYFMLLLEVVDSWYCLVKDVGGSSL